MRDFKNMKRQRGRNRGGGGGGGKPQHNANRAFDSNGPDNVKIRGHAQHVFEKYQQLARDAFSAGDRVLAENYLQHADHYFRVLRTIQPQRPPSEILGRDVLASGLDIDFEEEFEASEEAAETVAADAGAETGERQDNRDRYEARRDDGYRQDRGERQDRERQDNRDRQDNRYDRGERNDRYDRNRSDRYERNDQGGQASQGERSGERTDRGERNDRYEGRRDRFEGRRDDRSFNRDRNDRYDDRRNDERRPTASGQAEGSQPQREPLAASPMNLEGAPQPYLDVQPASVAPSPAVEASPTLRAEDGEVSDAPAFLHATADGEARRPRARRRRAPRSFDTAPEGAVEAEPSSAPEVEEA